MDGGVKVGSFKLHEAILDHAKTDLLGLQTQLGVIIIPGGFDSHLPSPTPAIIDFIGMTRSSFSTEGQRYLTRCAHFVPKTCEILLQMEVEGLAS